MDEAALDFDREKHACYSKEAKRVMLAHLSRRFSPTEVAAVWEKIQRQYVLYLNDLPALGGRKNMRSGAAGTYDYIALMAYWAALPDGARPDNAELYQMSCELFLPAFERLGRFVDLNRPLQVRLLDFAFNAAAKRTARGQARWPADYIMRTEPYNAALGARYRFEQCPLANFAREHGLLYLMPPFCNADYAAMELLHGALLRRHTCANGSVCDYRIVGDKHPDAAKYPRKTDSEGYWLNEI